MTRVPVLDHGYVELLDSMGRDIDIVNGARQSFDEVARLHQRGCHSTVSRDGECNCEELSAGEAIVPIRDRMSVKD